MLEKIRDFLNEYLRINAVRRLQKNVEVRKSEVAGLLLFSLLFAAFEGIGLSFLLPVMQYVELGRTAFEESSGSVWSAINSVLNHLNIPINLATLLILAFTPIVIRQIIYYYRAWYSAAVAGRAAIRARMKVVDIIYSADPEFFLRHPVGQTVNVVINLSTAGGAALLAVINYFSTLLLIALYGVILLMISAPLTLCTAAFAILVVYVVKSNIARIGAYSKVVAKRSQEMLGKIVERMALISLVKLRDQKKQEIALIGDFSEEMYGISIKQARLGATVEVTSDPLLMLSVFVTLFIGVTVFNMTLAQMGIVLFIINRLNGKIKELNMGRQLITNALANVSLLNEMLVSAREANKIHSGSTPFEGIKEGIFFRNVHFEYPDVYASDGTLVSKGKEVIKGIDLDIPKGSFVAFVGRSGAGKSTFVELVPRLRDVTSGALFFDDKNIKDYELGSLRKGVGYLKQSAMLFNDSVYSNLIYGLGFEATDEQIRKALEDAYATFVYDLPDGIHTIIGDGGSRFSGGERQRIALARVLLEDTDILVLDEPTSALDSESEASIQKALMQLHGKKTIIVIAHRLSTVMQADKLVVFENGHIAESGSHKELLQSDGAYARLFQNQIDGMISGA